MCYKFYISKAIVYGFFLITNKYFSHNSRTFRVSSLLRNIKGMKINMQTMIINNNYNRKFKKNTFKNC